MGRYSYNKWPEYVPVAERRSRAAKKAAKLEKGGRKLAPVAITGRCITETFWGSAWCKNLEAYSDYSNRLPRGKSYVRNGSVIDLQIGSGRIQALVSGSELYEVDIRIKPLPAAHWKEIKKKCAGQIGSLVELLRGSISKGVMEIVTRKGEGLFPSPREITLNCSCPDWAVMCKHVAATMFGVGARLDHEPELLFTLRGVDPAEMVEAALDQPVSAAQARKGRAIKTDDLSDIFGVEIALEESPEDSAPAPKKTARKRTPAPQILEKKKPAAKRGRPASKPGAKSSPTGKAKSLAAAKARKKALLAPKMESPATALLGTPKVHSKTDLEKIFEAIVQKRAAATTAKAPKKKPATKKTTRKTTRKTRTPA